LQWLFRIEDTFDLKHPLLEYDGVRCNKLKQEPIIKNGYKMMNGARVKKAFVPKLQCWNPDKTHARQGNSSYHERKDDTENHLIVFPICVDSTVKGLHQKSSSACKPRQGE
jgi:hypothetical protein